MPAAVRRRDGFRNQPLISRYATASPRGEALKETRLSQYSPVAARRRTPMSFRALVEKSPAVETARYVHAPAHLPMAARHREIPRNKNKNKRTRQPQILAGGGSPPRRFTEEKPLPERKGFPAFVIFLSAVFT